MISARPVTAASGRPPAMPFAVVIRSGHDALVLAGEPVAGAAEPGLDLVGDEQDAVGPAPLGDLGQEAGRRDDEAALALDRLDEHRGGVRLADLGVHQGHELLERLVGAVLRTGRPAERVGHRHPVDLAGERAEAVLVRHVLRRQRHRQVGASVVGVVEGDDRLPAGGVPGDLDRVLDRLGAGVEQRRALLVGARRQLVQLLGDRDVPLVRRDHEAGVGERRHLLLDGRRPPAGRRCRPTSPRCPSRSR